MNTFEERYAKLNEAQKRAVDTVEGAVLVVAGPGSGKTEILALRVARILKDTDAGPTSILCLTFTDSASATMRRRLAQLVGPEAYRVTIGTFHAFAQSVAEQYPAAFSNGASLTPVEAVESKELIAEALRSLPLSADLRKGHPSQEFTYLKAAADRIADLKKAGIGPDLFREVLAHNAKLMPEINAALAPLNDKISKKNLPAYAESVRLIQAIVRPPFPLSSYSDLATVIGRSLEAAILDVESTGKTEALTAWKKAHMKKSGGVEVLKASASQVKFESLADVYERYQELLAERGLRDFDDMIVDLLTAMRTDEDLRADLQERYQYVLVDEYQDTNGAQAELLTLLGDHPANEGNPNLMAVGDDDQAIYRFHGAGLEHILSFKERYPRATIVTMATNYRSRQGILDLAREHIASVGERLEGRIEGLSKKLVSGGESGGAAIAVLSAASREEERDRIAALIEKRMGSGTQPGEIAIIGRKHEHLEAVVPHLAERGIRVSYDRQRNALADPHVTEVIEVARAASAVSDGRAAAADPLLPRVLAFAFWGIPRLELWKLSRGAYAQKRAWLDEALESDCDPIRKAAELIVDIGTRSHDTPAGQLVDEIIGTRKTPEGRVSPFHEHYFGKSARSRDPEGVLSLVASLRSVIFAFGESRREQPVLLRDLVSFTDVRRAHGEPIKTHLKHDAGAVHLLTTHKAKGMEFDLVVVLHATDDAWLGKAPARLLSFPENLGVSAAEDNMDDKLRGLYVAITRAKRELIFAVSSADSGKGEPIPLVSTLPELGEELGAPREREQLSWGAEVPPVTADERTVFAPLVEDLQLTATQLNDFLNVAECGPEEFFERYVLRFPKHHDAHMRFGTAVHSVLEKVALDVHAGKAMPGTPQLTQLVEAELRSESFYGEELAQHLAEGVRIIGAYLEQKGDELRGATNVEVNFTRDKIMIGEARITGKADVIREEADGSLTIIDYKTGKPSEDWDAKKDEVKRHANRRQLLFYVLLAQKSQRFAGKRVGEAKLTFIKPDTDGRILELPIVPTEEELDRVAKLIQVVYRHAREIDLPDVSGYSRDLKGILAFEDDLLTKDP